MTVLHMPQGATRTIWVRDIVDDNGTPLDITGWTVHATAVGPGSGEPVVAEWHTTPTGSQGQATASTATVALAVPAAMSAAWSWRYAVLYIELTEPGPNGRSERFDIVGLIVEPE